MRVRASAHCARCRLATSNLPAAHLTLARPPIRALPAPGLSASPRSCLSHNDYQGLLYTYPVCDDSLLRTSSEPLCVKSLRNIGWLRFITATLPPFVFASIGVFALVQLALHYENKEQTRNRWKLGGLSAVQETRRRRQTEEEDFARGIFNKSISRGLSRKGTVRKKKKGAEADAAANAQKNAGPQSSEEPAL